MAAHNSFMKAAMRPVSSVKTFLRNSADNSIKYKAEPDRKHLLYIPFVVSTDENGEESRNIIAIDAKVHGLTPGADKYEAYICQMGLEAQDDDGNITNDGTCPFCDRVSAAWDIYRFKMNKDKERFEKFGYTGKDLDTQLKSSSTKHSSEREVKEADPYIYLLVVQYKLGSDDRPEIGPDGLPVFELKVVKLSDKSIKKIQETFDNSNLQFEGAEVAFKYANESDIRLLANSRTVSPIVNGRLIDTYPKLIDAINAAVSKWDWSGLERAFREWTPITTAAARAKCDNLFKAWDAYCADPNVGFLSTSSGAPAGNPALEQKPNTPVNTNMSIGTGQVGMGGVALPGMNTPNGQTNAGMGFGNGMMNMPDPSAVFGGGAPRI